MALTLVPATASARVTRTAITNPSAPYYAAYSEAPGAPERSVVVKGTSDGAPGDVVTIFCLPSNSIFRPASTRVRADGTFVAVVPSIAIGWGACTLRAVPADSDGEDLTPFRGQLVSLTLHDEAAGTLPIRNSIESATTLFRIYTGHRGGGARLFPTGYLGLDDVHPVAPDTLRRGTPTWASAAALHEQENPARAPIEVDGIASYGGTAALRFDYDGAGPGVVSVPEGFSGVQSAVAVDPQRGDVTAVESEAIVQCSGTEDARPRPDQCLAVSPSGIRHERIVRFTREHRAISVSDRWTSVDGAPHRLGVLLRHTVDMAGKPPVAWLLPGAPAFRTVATGEELRPRRGGSLLVRDATSGDASRVHTPAGMAFAAPPERFAFLTPASIAEQLRLEVPANGTVEVTHTFATAPTTAGVEALLPPPTRPGPPTLVVTAPAEGLRRRPLPSSSRASRCRGRRAAAPAGRAAAPAAGSTPSGRRR